MLPSQSQEQGDLGVPGRNGEIGAPGSKGPLGGGKKPTPHPPQSHLHLVSGSQD